MKVIILAAGMGTRLGKYTENLPKCMLNFNGKPLIQQQVETLRKAGITDISIVRGYQPEKIDLENVKDFLGKEKYMVNSYHNQAVTEETKGRELKVFAEAKMGIIEGLYHPTLPIAGMQWHPERKSIDININEKIIKTFFKKKMFCK